MAKKATKNNNTPPAEPEQQEAVLISSWQPQAIVHTGFVNECGTRVEPGAVLNGQDAYVAVILNWAHMLMPLSTQDDRRRLKSTDWLIAYANDILEGATVPGYQHFMDWGRLDDDKSLSAVADKVREALRTPETPVDPRNTGTELSAEEVKEFRDSLPNAHPDTPHTFGVSQRAANAFNQSEPPVFDTLRRG